MTKKCQKDKSAYVVFSLSKYVCLLNSTYYQVFIIKTLHTWHFLNIICTGVCNVMYLFYFWWFVVSFLSIPNLFSISDSSTACLTGKTHRSKLWKYTLESGIDVGQGISVGPGKFAKKNKRRALNKRRASDF